MVSGYEILYLSPVTIVKFQEDTDIQQESLFHCSIQIERRSLPRAGVQLAPPERPLFLARSKAIISHRDPIHLFVNVCGVLPAPIGILRLARPVESVALFVLHNLTPPQPAPRAITIKPITYPQQSCTHGNYRAAMPNPPSPSTAPRPHTQPPAAPLSPS